MKLYGHSKADLHYFETEHGSFVIKHGDNRLKLQVKKQKETRNALPESISHFIDIPCIIRQDENSCVMPFCNGEHILDLLQCGNITKIDFIIDSIFKFTEWEFNKSVLTSVTMKDFEHKLVSLKQCIYDKEIVNIIDDMLSIKFEDTFYVGECHGDLTLDNMIFDNKIVLIDFLDTYLESPIQDLAKLMQSVNLQWEFVISHKKYDYNKISIGYEYMKKEILSRCFYSALKWGISVFTLNLVYLINLIRIVPYISDKTVFYEAIKEIRRVYEDIKDSR